MKLLADIKIDDTVPDGFVLYYFSGPCTERRPLTLYRIELFDTRIGSLSAEVTVHNAVDCHFQVNSDNFEHLKELLTTNEKEKEE